MTISDQELFCDFYLWERIFVDSQINHKFVNPQICERGEIWECFVRPLAMGGGVFGGISDVDCKGFSDSQSHLLYGED